MFFIQYSVLVLVAFVASSQAAKLPPWATICDATSLTIDDCLTFSSQDALPKFAQGDPNYFIPKLIPLLSPEETLCDSSHCKMVLRNVRVFGLELGQILSTHIVISTPGTYFQSFYFPHLKLQSVYQMNINIPGLSTNGFGKIEITLVDVYANLTFNFQPDAEGNFIGFNDVATYSISNINYNLGSASTAVNNFFNANAPTFHNLFAPQVNKIFAKILFWGYQAIAYQVTAAEIFTYGASTSSNCTCSTCGCCNNNCGNGNGNGNGNQGSCGH